MIDRRRFIFLILIMQSLLLSGCWSQKELTDIAFVAALGIDKGEDGKYVGTIQIVNPANVATTGQTGGSQGAPVTVFSSNGDTLTETVRRATAKVSRRLYFTHTNLVVVGEQLAREEGINFLFDAIDRDPEFRTTATVVIAHDANAQDLIKILSIIEKVPANKVIKILESSEKRWGEHINTDVHEVIQGLVSPGKEPVISGFKIKGDAKQGETLENLQQSSPNTRIEANGIGIFKNGKLTDWFEGTTSRGALWVLDKISATAINLDWEEKKEAMVYDLLRQKTEVTASMEKNRPKISIKVRTEGQIGEVAIPIDLNDPTIILKIEKELEKQIKSEIEDAIQRAQENQTDVFGFGESVHRANPNEWKRLKLDWDEVHFPELDTDVTVDVFIRGTELRNKSYISTVENER
ncbi:spore germination protein KC [Bacillus oleivorans]|uniref:Spore germination protein KC n=1 Tax=Bacillus oleivorans TaxID=1448271 RepID=A0A285D3T8_9BACI|nr:Ger(x)C family spore germination protein [Bacillus oleivorans]SNX74439.1 spore germination protein KC [Bacillus oleivorans]